jgi:hypothetical protein
MKENKVSKLPILITVLATALIIVLLILTGNGKGKHVDAEHFVVQQGYKLSDYFNNYKASTVISFMNRVYGQELITKDLEELFTIKNDSEVKTDSETIIFLNAIAEKEIVQTAVNDMFNDYSKSLESIENDVKKDEFKKHLYQQLRGFLLDYSKERTRHKSKID